MHLGVAAAFIRALFYMFINCSLMQQLHLERALFRHVGIVAPPLSALLGLSLLVCLSMERPVSPPAPSHSYLH
jgi:hypothetical protein